MGLVDRVSRAVALGNVALNPADVALEAEAILAEESPWRLSSDVASVVARVTGLGPIQAYVDDPCVSDVLVNGHDDVWIDAGSGLEQVDVTFDSDEGLVATVERVIAPLGLRIDRASPMVDARLPDGSRLHAVLPPASVAGPLLAIRRFTQRVSSLEDLVASGTASAEDVDRLRLAVERRDTVVVSGGTGAGKTTLLNLVGASIPAHERVVTIEEAAELDIAGHVVRLEARPANTEGKGEITVRSLLKSALRLRPDRIIVGEVRGSEALDLITALNSGHRGSLTTVHANSPEEAMLRLETLALMSGESSETAVARQLARAVDLVVQIQRSGAERKIVAVTEASELDWGRL